MSPLMCPRCGHEIVPGDPVDLIGVEPDARIIVDDGVLIVHAVCPKEE